MDFALTDLEPRFLRYESAMRTGKFHKPGKSLADPKHQHTDKCWEERAEEVQMYRYVKGIADANGIWFLCPLCFENNGRKRPGVHGVICWSSSRGVPDSAKPGPGRWRLVGTGFADLSLMEETGKSRSVQLLKGCAWHGYVTNGRVT